MFQHKRPSKVEEHLRFSVVQPRPGEKLQGWISGPGCGVVTHHVKVTKPCSESLTEGVLTCKYCRSELGKGYTLYQPWFDISGVKCITLFSRDYEELLTSLPFGTPFEISKRKFKTAPVVPKVKEWSGMVCPFIGKLKCQHEVRPFLLMLWKEPQLEEHFGLDPEVIAVTDKYLPEHMRNKEVKNDDGSAWMEFHRMVRKKNSKEPQDTEPGQKNLKKPSTNGVH